MRDWAGQTAYVVSSGRREIHRMPNGFWRMLYGERVIGCGKICKIADDPVHKGNFIKIRFEADNWEDVDQHAIDVARQRGAKRIALVGNARLRSPDIINVLTQEDLEKVAYSTYTKVSKLGDLNDGRIVIIAGGATVPYEAIQKGLLASEVVLGVNRVVALGSDCLDVCFFGDARAYWGHNGKECSKPYIDEFKGVKYSCNLKWPSDTSLVGLPGIKLIRADKHSGLSLNQDKICFNKSSGGAAIDLAVKLGAKQIILIGYDMQGVKGKVGWYEKKFPEDLQGMGWQKKKEGMYDHFMGAMDKVANDAKKMNIEILNASPVSAMECFKKVKLEDVLK